MPVERVAKVSDVPEDEALQVHVGDRPIALVRADGRIWAVHDVCSHEFAHLSEGFVEGCTIECPLHGSVFDVRTGEAMTLPATSPVATYEVRIEGEDVLVEVPE